MREGLAASRQLEELAAFVHGALAALHGLGIAYNLKKRNWGDVAAHTAAATYDVWALRKHLESIDGMATLRQLP